MIDRRKFIASSALLGTAIGLAPTIAFARAATDKRLLFVIQRGAADGLGVLAPIGDPGFAQLRHNWVEDARQGTRADGFFAIHPRLETLARTYAAGDALFVHGVASSYRERSHFDGQNLLETGGPKAYVQRDGWLNRLVGMMPDGEVRALALASAIPMAMQGKHSVSSYAPTTLPEASADLAGRISSLYESDPQLSDLWQEALRTRAMAGTNDMRNLRNATATGELAASLMSGEDGARIMMVESSGWDSHANQPGQIGNALGRLDAFLAAFRTGMAGAWADTLVVVATEFGRTARMNGTNGTDHGTASASLLLGGQVRGNRVVADWPGLRPGDLYQERDVRPTRALEAVIAGSVAEHFALDPARTMASLFPGRTAKPELGFLRG